MKQFYSSGYALFLALVFALFPLAAQAQAPNAWINEFHYDDTGGGSDFVEIAVENAGSVDLGKLDVEKYRDDGTRYSPIGDVDADFVEEKTVGSFTIYTWTTTLQNGPSDGLALCFDDAPLQVISYEGTFTATEACANGETSTNIGVSEGGNNPNTTSLQLKGSGTAYSDFAWTGPLPNTKGDVNTGQTLSGNFTITVDDDGSADYASIQNAIDAAGTGSTIEVLDGLYAEKIAVDKQLTLEGPNAGIPGDGSRGSEATIEGQVVISASDVVFDGFDVAPPAFGNNTSEGEAVRVSNAPDNVTVTNTVVRDFEDGSGATDFFDATAINAFGGDDSDPLQDVTISNNKVARIAREVAGGAVGISIQGNVDGATVTGNVIQGVGQARSAYALGVAVRSTDNHSVDPTGVSVTGNEISDVRPDPQSDFDGVGFEFEPENESNVASLTVENNTFNSTTLQVEDKTSDRGLSGLDLESVLADNTFDRAVVIRGASGDIKAGPNNFRKVYSSLSAPVSDASPNDIVELEEATGTYPGGLTIDQPLTLRGDASPSPSLTSKATASCTKSAVIDASGTSQGISLTGSGVTLANLCVKNADNHNLYTDVTISNLTLNGVEAINAGNQGLEVHNSAAVTSLTISNSTFSGNNKGMRIRGSVEGLDVSDSGFDGNNTGFETTHGNQADENKPVTGVSITNTTFNDNPEKGLYVEKLDDADLVNITVQNSGTDKSFGFRPQAVDINLKYGDYSSILVENATISGSIGEGLNVKARNDSFAPEGIPQYDENPASLSGLTVDGGTFEDNRWGVVVGYNVQAATIKGNLIQNNGTEPDDYQDIGNPDNRGGILFYGAPTETNYQVLNNCITGNQTYGLLEDLASGTVVANGNWWGASSGPGGDFDGSGDPALDFDTFGDDGTITENHSDQKVGACPSSAQCDTPTLAADDIDKQNGTLSNTISDDDGVEEFTFTTLDGFKVISSFDSGFDKNSKGLDEGGVSWTWTGSGDPPTSVPFELGATETTATYFLEVTDACDDPGPNTTTFDPAYEFGPVATQARLAGNAPNPFSGRTTVEFTLPEQTRVTVSVYDMMGRKVATLVDGVRSSGPHTVSWNGRADGGQDLASGVYLLRMQADDRSETRRITIVR